MGKKTSVSMEASSIVHDGKLTQAEALSALRIAAQDATDALRPVSETISKVTDVLHYKA